MKKRKEGMEATQQNDQLGAVCGRKICALFLLCIEPAKLYKDHFGHSDTEDINTILMLNTPAGISN